MNQFSYALFSTSCRTYWVVNLWLKFFIPRNILNSVAGFDRKQPPMASGFSVIGLIPSADISKLSNSIVLALICYNGHYCCDQPSLINVSWPYLETEIHKNIHLGYHLTWWSLTHNCQCSDTNFTIKRMLLECTNYAHSRIIKHPNNEDIIH